MSEHISSRRGRPPRDVVYDRLDVQIEELWNRLGGLPHPVEAQDIWRGLWFEEAHHSTAIEGNTLVLKQVEALLERGRAVGNKELAEYLEVRGSARHRRPGRRDRSLPRALRSGSLSGRRRP